MGLGKEIVDYQRVYSTGDASTLVATVILGSARTLVVRVHNLTIHQTADTESTQEKELHLNDKGTVSKKRSLRVGCRGSELTKKKAPRVLMFGSSKEA